MRFSFFMIILGFNSDLYLRKRFRRHHQGQPGYIKSASQQLSYYSKPAHTANEEPVRIQYKCLFPIYVFPEIKLLFPKQNYNVLSLSSFTHISARDLYISKIGLPILLHGNMWTDPGNI